MWRDIRGEGLYATGAWFEDQIWNAGNGGSERVAQRVGEHSERLFIESVTEVPYSSDATCVTLEDIPLGTCQWSAK